MRPARVPRTEATVAEWAWLTAAPDLNPFIGFSDPGRITTWDRLQRLWEAHEPEIRHLWGDTPPALPYGHPAAHGGRVGCPVKRRRAAEKL